MPDGMIWIFAAIVIALIFSVPAIITRNATQKLDRELTAYVANGSLTTHTAKQIRDSKASTTRKREIAALVAEGMPPTDAIALLSAMPQD